MSEREYVIEKLSCMHVDYDLYLNIRQTESASTGLVASYNAVGGGRTNRITSLTEQAALRAAGYDAKLAERLRWIDCVWSVFMQHMAKPEDRSRNVAYVLFHRALLGWTYARIASSKLPNGRTVSRQYIYQLYDKAVDAVMIEVKKNGLLR